MRQVTIENATIDGLAGDEALRRAVPCLATFQARKAAIGGGPGCSSCRKAADAKAHAANYSETKACLLSLGPEALARLKQALGADTLKVIVGQGGAAPAARVF